MKSRGAPNLVHVIASPSTMMAPCLTQTVKMSGISTKTAERTESLGTFATLRFSGDLLEPDRVTAILGVEPTTAYRKGEIYRRKRGDGAHGRTGVWYLSTQRDLDSRVLADHLRYLVGVVCPAGRPDHISALRELMERDGVEADVSCFWHGRAGAKAPVVPGFARDVFGRLGARIETDFDTD
jgi:hypothetical protein